ncbi:MAG: DUF1049 domain-containing protein [Nitrospirae bacterium]|nr:DUF1049 domain-containing protein [Nitrospirota bacterium]
MAKLIIFIILAFLTALFIISNLNDVHVKFLGWDVVSLPIYLLLIITLIIGIVLGFIAAKAKKKK